MSDSIAIPNDALPQVEAGEHQLKAELRDSTQKPLSPAVEHLFTVPFPNPLRLSPRGPTPSLAIQSPASGAHLKRATPVLVKADGLAFDGTQIGRPVLPGVGHWHLLVDDQYAGLSVTDVITLPNDAFPSITAGPHTLKVQLDNNLRQPLNPPVVATVRVIFDQQVTTLSRGPRVPGKTDG